MPAARGSRFLLGWFGFVAVLSLPVLAQSPYIEFHGIPPSGIGGANAFAAARQNVNLGMYGGANFFFPSSFSPLVPYPTPAGWFGNEPRGRRHHHHEKDGVAVVAEPVYIPYAVPYAVDEEDDAAEDQNEAGAAAGESEVPARSYSGSSGGRNRSRARTTTNGMARADKREAELGGDATGDDLDRAGSAADAGIDAVPVAAEPVVTQPTTVLVFKDGHRSEIVNYAIVGGTLFDFSGDRARKIRIADLDLVGTEKANDAAGVEFKLPPVVGVN
ncbi:MAG TPA: hypothetical protein VMI10_19900 [Terriglobales bacterium]|nr:hypothetical protein [Terriglobales bacterium]